MRGVGWDRIRGSRAVVYRFGPFELDENVYELRREGADLRIRRRSFEVLRLLIDERHRVVSKDEVLDRVWERRYVSQSALANCISELRSAVRGRTRVERDHPYGLRSRLPLRRKARRTGGAAEPRGERHGTDGVAAPLAEGRPHDAFVGRERELERLEAALDAAMRGPRRRSRSCSASRASARRRRRRASPRARARGRCACWRAAAPTAGSRRSAGPGRALLRALLG